MESNIPPPPYEKAIATNITSQSQRCQPCVIPIHPPCYDSDQLYSYSSPIQCYVPMSGIGYQYPSTKPIVPPPGSITVVTTPHYSVNSQSYIEYSKGACISSLLLIIFVGIMFPTIFLLIFVANAEPQVIAPIVFGEVFLFFIVMGLTNFCLMKKYNEC